MATWPMDLPDPPLVNGYQTGPRSNIVSFPTDAGVTMTRRRGTGVSKSHAFSFQMTTYQFVSIFEPFFEDTLKDGSLPFTWTDPVRGDSADWKFNPQNPYQAAFVPNGDGVMIVSCALERQP